MGFSGGHVFVHAGKVSEPKLMSPNLKKAWQKKSHGDTIFNFEYNIRNKYCAPRIEGGSSNKIYD